jgi:hypothetical protein
VNEAAVLPATPVITTVIQHSSSYAITPWDVGPTPTSEDYRWRQIVLSSALDSREPFAE